MNGQARNDTSYCQCHGRNVAILLIDPVERTQHSLLDQHCTMTLNLPSQHITYNQYHRRRMLTITAVKIFSVLTSMISPTWRDGGGGQWALVSADGVAPSRMVSESASVNLPLHHKV